MTSPPGPSEPAAAGVHEAARREKLRKISALGIDPWGSRFDQRQWIGDVRRLSRHVQFQTADGQLHALPDFNLDPRPDYRAWKAALGGGEEQGPHVRVAGRIYLQRTAGKLIFLTIHDWTGVIQVAVGKGQVAEGDFELTKLLDLGDWVGIDGRLGYTNTGELTVFASRLHFLTKMLEPPPEKHAGLTDPELRQRLRYLDLNYTDGVRESFLNRTKIIKAVRQTLDDRQYIEIEGPTLHTIAGGAAARPFKTHHNALDMPLVLRIALELHLKRLLVGGLERVYELGRVYRNEGISPRHNPEFTMLEAYEAFGDYRTMMDLTESVILAAIEAVDGNHQRQFNGQQLDFTPPFRRATYDGLIAEHLQIDPTSASAIADRARLAGIEVADKHPDVIKSELFEALVEDRLVGPIFVMDYPASICPLTKRKATNPEVAERFELYACGMELANAYTELNDPDLQEQLFQTQLAGLAADESMARMDHDFIRALRHGMPPAGGLGIGIDRLIMLLLDRRSIRDVILFPLLRNTQ
jgi:lysyl-tRNA synthetase class 2